MQWSTQRKKRAAIKNDRTGGDRKNNRKEQEIQSLCRKKSTLEWRAEKAWDEKGGSRGAPPKVIYITGA